MARGRHWTLEEDQAIREAARANYRPGGYTADVDPAEDAKPLFERRIPSEREYARRLAEVARRFNRSREAVYKRAQRIGARSKQPVYFGRKGKA